MKKFEAAAELETPVFKDEIRARSLTSGVVVNQDLSMGAALMITAPDTSCMGVEGKSSLRQELRAAVNSLPAHFDFEIRSVPVFRTDEIAATFAAQKKSAGLAGDVVDEGEKAHLANLEANEIRFYRHYVIIVRRMPLTFSQRRARTMAGVASIRKQEDKGEKIGLGEKVRRFVEDVKIRLVSPDLLLQMTEQEYEEASGELLLYVRTIAQSLDQVGLVPVYCDNDQVLEIFYQFWNRRRYDRGSLPLPFRASERRPISDYYAISDFDWGKDIPKGMYYQDGLYHKIVTLLVQPQNIGEPYWPHFEDTLLVSGPKKMEVIVKAAAGDLMKRKKLLRTEMIRTERALATKKNDRDELQRKYDAIVAERDGLANSLEKTWKAAVYFHLWDESPDQLKESATQLMMLANKLDCELVEETNGLLRYVRVLQPFWSQDIDRHRVFDYNTRQIVDLLPLCGQRTYLGKKDKIGAVFETVTGSLYNFFVHDPRRVANPHVAVAAGSRAGKSVLFESVLVELTRYPLRAAIIDLGGSYRRFCEVQAGNYVEYDPRDRTKRLNPLYIANARLPDEMEVTSRVLGLEQMLCATRKGERFTKDDLPQIIEALKLTYRSNEGREIILSDLLRQFRSMGLTRWASRLVDWCGDGTKAAAFDGLNTYNLSNRLTVFDFAKVRDDQELAPVLFHTATNLIGQLASEYPNDLKIVGIDEASSHLKNPTSAEFFDQGIRQYAKNGISMWVLSQNFSDFTENETLKDTFINNVGTWIFLKQDGASVVDEIAREKRLPDPVKEKLGKLRTVFGEYSEFLVVQNTNAGPETAHCYNVSTPLKYALTTTAASDRAVFARLIKQMPVPDAVRRFASEYPRGAEVQFGPTNNNEKAA